MNDCRTTNVGVKRARGCDTIPLDSCIPRTGGGKVTGAGSTGVEGGEKCIRVDCFFVMRREGKIVEKLALINIKEKKFLTHTFAKVEGTIREGSTICAKTDKKNPNLPEQMHTICRRKSQEQNELQSCGRGSHKASLNRQFD